MSSPNVMTSSRRGSKHAPRLISDSPNRIYAKKPLHAAATATIDLVDLTFPPSPLLIDLVKSPPPIAVGSENNSYEDRKPPPAINSNPTSSAAKEEKKTIFNKELFKHFLMPRKGNIKVRRIRNIRESCKRMLNILKKHHHVAKIDGEFADDLTAEEITRNGGVYIRVTVDDGFKTLVKVGSTRNFQNRKSQSEDTGAFYIVIDIDNISIECEEQLQEEYEAVQEILLRSDEVPTFQKHLFSTIFESGGDRLGIKRQMIIQFVEVAMQASSGLSCIFECLMFDEDIAQELYVVSTNEATPISKQLAVLKGRLNDEDCYWHAVSSWKTGSDSLSSKIETTKCCLGVTDESSMITDTLPMPAVPNAKTRAEIFSRDYSASKKKQGRKEAVRILQMLLSKKYGVVLFDINNMIFAEDKMSEYRDTKSFLESFQFRLEKLPRKYSNIDVFEDPSGNHFVLLHRPLGVASDSQDCISDEERIQHGIDAAVLTNVFRDLRNLPYLSPSDEFQNPLNALMAFHIVKNGMHNGLRQAAAFYRFFVFTDFTATSNPRVDKTLVNPLIENGLAKTVFSAAPISKHNRVKYRNGKRSYLVSQATIAREGDDWLVQRQARNILSHATTASLPLDYVTIMELFSTISSSSRDKKYSRLSRFVKKQLVPDSRLARLFVSIHDNSVDNPGNRLKGTGKAATDQEIIDNNQQLNHLVNNFGPDQNGKESAKYFWIAENTQAKKHPPMNGTKSNCGQYVFPGPYFVYEGHTKEGLFERFKERNTDENKNSKINDMTSDTFPHLGMANIKSKNRFGVKVHQKDANGTPVLPIPKGKNKTKEHIPGFLLVKLQLKKGYTMPSNS